MKTTNTYNHSIYSQSFEELEALLEAPHAYDIWYTDRLISHEQSETITKSLTTNSVLSQLTFTSNGIDDVVTENLASALKVNVTLRYLDLSYNQIGGRGGIALSEALSKNETLNFLYLCDNHVGEEGGVALGRMLEVNKALTKLYLNNNHIMEKGGMSVATGLENNTSLIYLDINSNSIGENAGLAFSQMLTTNRTLSTLYMYDNKLERGTAVALIDALKHNKSLIYIGLRNNSITPDQLEKILHLVGNNANIQKAAYYASLQSNEKGPWHRSRLMCIGEGMAGKTATVRSILSEQFDAQWKSTIGITLTETTVSSKGIWKSRDSTDFTSSLVHKLAYHEYEKKKVAMQRNEDKLLQKHMLNDEVFFAMLKKTQTNHGEKRRLENMYKFEERLLITAKHKRDDLTLSIWDYGGQRVFHALHHLFLTEYGIYLLIFSMEQLLRTGDPRMQLKFWLDSLKIYAPDAPVFLIGTFLDKVDGAGLEVVEKHMKELWRSCKLPVVKNDNLSFYPVDNRGAKGIRRLRQKLRFTAQKQEYVHFRVSVNWMKCLDMMNTESEHTGWIAMKRVREMSKLFGISTSEHDSMLRLFHELGVILHFTATSSLREAVTTNPQWLIHALSKVIRDRKQHKFNTVEMENVGLTQDANDLYANGIASRDLLEYLWTKEQTDFLLDLTQRLLLLSVWSFKDGEIRYLIPSMVNNRKQLPTPTGLRCKVNFEILPNGVFERLVCLCVHLSASKFEDQSSTFDIPELKRNLAMIPFGDEATVWLSLKKDELTVHFNSDSGHESKYLHLILSMLRLVNQHIKNEGLKWAVWLECGGWFLPLIEAKVKKIEPWFPKEKRISRSENELDLESFLS